ncbi:hypothetical protein NL676_004841 [Syzygium grande]|nr:hypothetical protein NL676_004841 [Syzygium grande]
MKVGKREITYLDSAATIEKLSTEIEVASSKEAAGILDEHVGAAEARVLEGDGWVDSDALAAIAELVEVVEEVAVLGVVGGGSMGGSGEDGGGEDETKKV